MKLLAIDFGEKRVGVALSDIGGKIAFPYSVIKNDDKLVDSVVDLIKKEYVKEIIFGMSVDFTGKENPIMLNAKKIANELEDKTNLLVIFQNESYSSFHAHNEKFAITGENTNKDIDASAAAIILQRYIDSKNNGNN